MALNMFWHMSGYDLHQHATTKLSVGVSFPVDRRRTWKWKQFEINFCRVYDCCRKSQSFTRFLLPQRFIHSIVLSRGHSLADLGRSSTPIQVAGVLVDWSERLLFEGGKSEGWGSIYAVEIKFPGDWQRQVNVLPLPSSSCLPINYFLYIKDSCLADQMKLS